MVANSPDSSVGFQACHLAGMIEALSVIQETLSDGIGGNIIEKRASNSLGPMFDAVIEKAWSPTVEIEEADMTHVGMA